MDNDLNIPSKLMKFRTSVIMTSFFVGLFFIIICKFLKLTVIDSNKYQNIANNLHFASKYISAYRGSIYDAKGITFAKNVTTYNVILDPKQFKNDMNMLQNRIDQRKNEKKEVMNDNVIPISALAFKEEIISFLTSKLGIDADNVIKAIETDNQYVIIKENVEKSVSDELLAFFKKYDFTCIFVEKKINRYYPQNELAASVIGFTNNDGNGIYGLEAYYNEYLSGIDGKFFSEKDSAGNEIPYNCSKKFYVKNGNDIYMTIDRNIQYYLEKHLKEMVNKFQIKNRGCAILMNAKTGAIYGMAVYPSFNLNTPYELTNPFDIDFLEKNNDINDYAVKKAEFREKQWRNKCISERYEPGSVFKVNTSAAAIEENLINLINDKFICNGFIKINGHFDYIRCHNIFGHGVETFQKALTNSCNPAFIEIGNRLGINKFLYYYDILGLRSPTGIDLPAENSGFQKYPDNMTNVDLAYSAFGQCETVTPIEMLVSYCAAINGGYLLKPYVVDKVVNENGNIVLKNKRTVKCQVYSKKTSDIMRNALYHVATESEGKNLAIEGYTIGGKSGTSERLSETNPYQTNHDDHDSDEYCASYCCFLPVDDPEIILLVLGDMPYTHDMQYYGSIIAVPTVRKILTDVIPYLGIINMHSNNDE